MKLGIKICLWLLRRVNDFNICFMNYESEMLLNNAWAYVKPRLLQKGVSENFDLHVTLRYHQSYKLAAEYIYIF